MRQLFKVEEVVIISNCSKQGINGQLATVLECCLNDSGIDSNGNYTKNKTTYRLDFHSGYTDWFTQSCLKKHYPPSTKSSTEIMEELKGPVKA